MKRRKFIRSLTGAASGILILPSLLSCSNGNRPFSDILLPAPVGGGFSMDDYWVWGASVIKGQDD